MLNRVFFRSPDSADRRLCLLSGHTISVGSEWMELAPVFHQEAYAAGCEHKTVLEAMETPLQASPEQIQDDIEIAIPESERQPEPQEPGDFKVVVVDDDSTTDLSDYI